MPGQSKAFELFDCSIEIVPTLCKRCAILLKRSMAVMQVGAESNDAFLGLLRENRVMGQRAFGPTMSLILTDQFHRVLFGSQGSWWEDDFLSAVSGWEAEIRATSLGKVISDNTGISILGNGFSAR
jgi:hypothetical protein